MSVVVQLVVALTGLRFFFEVRHQKSPSLLASSSVSLLSQTNITTSTNVFVSDIMAYIHNFRFSPVGNSNSVSVGSIDGNKKSYVELFDYNSLQPLYPNDIVEDRQKLLLFAPPAFSELISEQLSHRCRPAEGESQGTSIEDEERWQNLRQAISALQVPLTLHQQIMEREMEACAELLTNTEEQFVLSKENIHAALERAESIKLFYRPDTHATELIDRRHLHIALQQGEVKLKEAAKSLESARAMAPTVVEAIKAEIQVVSDLEKMPAWQSYTTAAADKNDESSIIQLMQEVVRKVQVVRTIISDIALITKRQQKCRHYCAAIVDHVIQHHKRLVLLPEGLEAAREVLHRRIILRRAARRLLVPLEAEHRATEMCIHQFAEKWGQWLPESLFKAVASPLPPLYPQDDTIAQEMDSLFVDLQEDATEELLAAIGTVSSSSDNMEQYMLQQRLAEVERELQRCKALLEVAAVEKAELMCALNQNNTTSSSA
ncbi:uncharacterized protein TM35_000082180 [Trypanosoma theileri]|uniref:Uncharacterized protein n=1 Tax=Trypanosoma theileri TaxID=67003 RepID=A0A1X0P1Y3_9TRYP|nr:uncharacterized protein TM35_000082180 [Trypanosoma theileri]ORC90420.1 hypothetical protein TM35_000082180 [Trypanosoma theileri]